MSQSSRACIAVVAFAACASLPSAPQLAGADVETTKTISAADLSSGKVVITGLLGVPLQEMMTIRGTWHLPDAVVKDASFRFRVSHVDGKKLANPVDFREELVRVTSRRDDEPLPPSDGATWEFRGFETGRFRERPQQYYIEIGLGPVQTRYGGFTTELEGFIPGPAKAAQQPAQKSRSKAEKKSR